MKLLEYKDINNNKASIPLMKSIFKSISYPLGNELSSAQLFTVDNKVISVHGTDFKLTNFNGGAAIG
ncbi:hypothetical protein [Vagococcus carniphilus]|uniref:hypothetical protein n=1 Tax=Vagococcus carniphilus TaxID=218144 RepID=UPI00288FC487|nr:hypothetical protein [Vagococcus carniphilus]MDT2865444.1 hypothetical protein [Vagococcus carniphilus]